MAAERSEHDSSANHRGSHKEDVNAGLSEESVRFCVCFCVFLCEMGTIHLVGHFSKSFFFFPWISRHTLTLFCSCCKRHEGRVYWFNTYLFERPDLSRLPCFDPRKLARKATNYLLLGLSIPTINDLYSSTPIEFLRCLNSLLSEFDSFQQIHGESSAALARARLPTMFRRPGGKSRRTTSAADMHLDDSHAFPPPGGAGAANSAPSVMNFAASESELLPGEEYTYLLTPALPFEPDFFETFAALCDVLIDCYSRFLALVPTPRECSAPVAELFTKADLKLRKIIVQGVVKEFEDHSRGHVKTEVASIGKVVLGGLM